MSQVRHPPLEPVRTIIRMLELAGLPVALGGSAVLGWLELVDRVGDWDVTVEGSPDEVLDVLAEGGFEVQNRTDHGFPFASTALFAIAAEGHEVDVLVGFALRDGDTVVPIPVRVVGRWRGLPIAHPVDWQLAYRLMGRTEREATLRAALENSDWIDR